MYEIKHENEDGNCIAYFKNGILFLSTVTWFITRSILSDSRKNCLLIVITYTNEEVQKQIEISIGTTSCRYRGNSEIPIKICADLELYMQKKFPDLCQ